MCLEGITLQDKVLSLPMRDHESARILRSPGEGLPHFLLPNEVWCMVSGDTGQSFLRETHFGPLLLPGVGAERYG